MRAKHIKSKKKYVVLTSNVTNKTTDEPMVLYCDSEANLYVRNKKEFYNKFVIDNKW